MGQNSILRRVVDFASWGPQDSESRGSRMLANRARGAPELFEGECEGCGAVWGGRRRALARALFRRRRGSSSEAR